MTVEDTNNRYIIDQSNREFPKGTILLIHGTGPQNIDGAIPSQIAEKYAEYARQPIYKELAVSLNALGWNTARYTRLGVYQNHVNFEEYGTTDFKAIMDQLYGIWKILPSNIPKIAFAWSGGSIHVSHLPLDEAGAIIMLGGLATNRPNAQRLLARNEEELEQVNKTIENYLAQEGKISRETMFGVDRPYGRMFDESKLEDNWRYFEKFPRLPILILHGEKDAEVNPSQARIWKEKLPNHRIKVIIKPSANHAFGIGKESGMKDLANVIDNWLQGELYISDG